MLELRAPYSASTSTCRRGRKLRWARLSRLVGRAHGRLRHPAGGCSSAQGPGAATGTWRTCGPGCHQHGCCDELPGNCCGCLDVESENQDDRLCRPLGGKATGGSCLCAIADRRPCAWRRRCMIERKADVLGRLLRSSWMVDAGWSAPDIAAHYQADRDWRAAVKRLRRRGVVPTIGAIKEYQRSVARRRRG